MTYHIITITKSQKEILSGTVTVCKLLILFQTRGIHSVWNKPITHKSIRYTKSLKNIILKLKIWFQYT